MFLVSSGALENRFDPIYYSADLFGFLKTTNYLIKKIKEVTKSLKSGFGAGKQDQAEDENGIIQIRPTNIGNEGNLKFDKNICLPLDLLETHKESLLQKGDVLFNNTNSQELVGKTVYFEEEGNYFFSNHITRIRVKENEILPQFLSLILNAFHSKKIFYSICTNWNNQSGVGIDLLGSLKIPIPPIHTQTQIIQLFAQAYESKKAKETEAKRLLASIDAYLLEKLGIRSATFQVANDLENRSPFFVKFSQVQGKRFDPFYHKTEFEENIEAIKNGKYKAEPLKSVVHKLIKGRLPKDHEKDGVCKVVQINSIRENGNIDIDDLLTAKEIFMSEHKMQKNDVLVVITGATIGKIAIWEQQESEDYFLGGDIVKFQCFANTNPHFVFAWLRFKNSQIEIKRNVTGATNGHLSPSDIGNILIPLPPLFLQTEIAEHISGIRAEAKRLENEAKDEITKAKKEVERLILG